MNFLSICTAYIYIHINNFARKGLPGGERSNYSFACSGLVLLYSVVKILLYAKILRLIILFLEACLNCVRGRSLIAPRNRIVVLLCDLLGKKSTCGAELDYYALEMHDLKSLELSNQMLFLVKLILIRHVGF
jgi:hypothetical protein